MPSPGVKYTVAELAEIAATQVQSPTPKISTSFDSTGIEVVVDATTPLWPNSTNTVTVPVFSTRRCRLSPGEVWNWTFAEDAPEAMLTVLLPFGLKAG